MQSQHVSEQSSLHSVSRLSRADLLRSSGELGLHQLKDLLMQKELQADRVADPGSPAFDYGLTHSDLVVHSLRAAQIELLAS
jgi:hypothetical protein